MTSTISSDDKSLLKIMKSEMKDLKKLILSSAEDRKQGAKKVEEMLTDLIVRLEAGRQELTKPKKVKKPRKPKAKDIGETDYTIKFNLNAQGQKRDSNTYVKFSVNAEFTKFVKELGGEWKVAAQGWLVPEEHTEDIQATIKDKFPKWSVTDERKDGLEMATPKPAKAKEPVISDSSDSDKDKDSDSDSDSDKDGKDKDGKDKDGDSDSDSDSD
uniref:Uncharacterized protein n=1 Tax=viral metagenome TaxID=1070528 RepID=A0A6C0KAS9_9ZZZZ